MVQGSAWQRAASSETGLWTSVFTPPRNSQQRGGEWELDSWSHE